jgi:ABC-2 type transport system permease protein
VETKKYAYFNLIRELAITDFKLKYQGSVIGYMWSLMKPLAVFGVLYLVFTVFVKIGATIPNYPAYLLLGIVLWTYFADSTNAAMNAIVDKGDLLRKVYFPRIVILIASSISALITLFLNVMVIVAFILIARIDININALLFLPLIAELYVLSLGVSLFLSALYVKYRDFSHIWEVTTQLLFYASAIIYPLSIVPSKYIPTMLTNPIIQIIQDARHVLITPETTIPLNILHGWILFVPYLIPFILLILGYLYFQRTAKYFAEEI